MKEYGCCPKFKRGDNSTYTFTKTSQSLGELNFPLHIFLSISSKENKTCLNPQ
jgi:hypothetical protein